MESHAMDGALLSQVTSASMVVYLLQFLKKTSWYPRFAAWLPIADAHVHRLVSIAGAFVSAVGVHIAFTGNATTGWQFAGTIPPLTVLLHAGWDWLQQFALNQLTYDAVAQKAGVTVVTNQASSDVGQRLRDELNQAVRSKPVATVALLLAATLSAGVLVSSCASFQAKQHPNLSAVGDVVANVKTIDDDVIKIQAKVEAFVTVACGSNQTSSCLAAQGGADIMRATKVIGAGSQGIGQLFAAYLAATDAVAKAKAEQNLLAAIPALETQAAALATSTFANLQTTYAALKTDVDALVAGVKKGQ